MRRGAPPALPRRRARARRRPAALEASFLDAITDAHSVYAIKHAAKAIAEIHSARSWSAFPMVAFMVMSWSLWSRAARRWSEIGSTREDDIAPPKYNPQYSPPKGDLGAPA